MSFDMARRPMILPNRLRSSARPDSERPTPSPDRGQGAADDKGPKDWVDALDVWSPLNRRGTPRRRDTRR